MSRAASTFERSWLQFLTLAATASVGVTLALSGLPPAAAVAIVAAAFVYVFFGAVSIREPLIFVAAFLLVLEVLPPLYFSASGETPIFVSFLMLPIALSVILIRFPDFRFTWDPVAKGLGVFLAGTAASIPFGLWL